MVSAASPVSLHPGTAFPRLVLHHKLPKAVTMVQLQHRSRVGWGDRGNALPTGDRRSCVSTHPFSSWPRPLCPRTRGFRANNIDAPVKAELPFLFYSTFHFITVLSKKKKNKNTAVSFLRTLSLTSYIVPGGKGLPFKMVNEKQASVLLFFANVL